MPDQITTKPFRSQAQVLLAQISLCALIPLIFYAGQNHIAAVAQQAAHSASVMTVVNYGWRIITQGALPALPLIHGPPFRVTDVVTPHTGARRLIWHTCFTVVLACAVGTKCLAAVVAYLVAFRQVSFSDIFRQQRSVANLIEVAIAMSVTPSLTTGVRAKSLAHDVDGLGQNQALAAMFAMLDYVVEVHRTPLLAKLFVSLYHVFHTKGLHYANA